MAQKKKWKFKIIDGPSIWDLMLALFDPLTKRGSNRSIAFTLRLNPNQTLEINVSALGLERIEDPELSGLWKIKGILNTNLTLHEAFKDLHTEYQATFLTGNRRGELSFTN